MSKAKTTCAVVTHSNVIQIILAHVQKIDMNKLWEMPIPESASVTLLESHSPARIVSMNDINHLADLESDLSVQAI